MQNKCLEIGIVLPSPSHASNPPYQILLHFQGLAQMLHHHLGVL